MGTCLDRGIKVVSNAGGLDPDGCAEAVAEVADRLGLSPTIAYVEGRRPAAPTRRARAPPASTSPTSRPASLRSAGDTSRFISANAYLGCWGIVEALRRRRRHRRHRPHHRRRGRVRPGRVAPRLAARRLGRARRRGRRRPRHRVRHPGDRRQLLVLHRGARHDARRLPLGRDRRRRIVGDRQARRHRRRGLDRHRHVAAALRDRRPGVPRTRRQRPLRHHRARAGRPGPGPHLAARGASRRRRR